MPAAAPLRVAPDTLRHVVLTHAHVDHCGLAGPVRAWSVARVAMHEREEALVRAFVDGWPADREHAAEDFRAHGVPADVAPELVATTDRIHAQYDDFRPDDLLSGDGGELPRGGGWEWMLTPGHSPGHVSVYHPDLRVLIAGDHVLPLISRHVGADRYVADPLSEYLESLARLRDLPVELVLPSHGVPFEDLAGRVDGILAHHDARNAQLLALLDRPRTARDLALRVFPGAPRTRASTPSARRWRTSPTSSARPAWCVRGQAGGGGRHWARALTRQLTAATLSHKQPWERGPLDLCMRQGLARSRVPPPPAPSPASGRGEP